jgi:hypothetical protein
MLKLANIRHVITEQVPCLGATVPPVLRPKGHKADTVYIMVNKCALMIFYCSTLSISDTFSGLEYLLNMAIAE